ncbi:MAG TPA: carbamoyltransferase HypF [Acetobacteraceae bacterium]|nr:carbamoyltransferase HypF [Acetobacteraceae bacterium]
MRLRVRGQVQGVGFRPHVWRLAVRDGLTGFAMNDQDGVLLEVQGNVAGFVADLVALAPPLARIDAVEQERRPIVLGELRFVIRDSTLDGPARTAITPDVATCSDCLSELFDPADRRYLYPFITCTQCGPRFTITRRLPYDRSTTAMVGYPLCAACASEYENPADRRFHAETNCCPACGPRLDMPSQEVAARIGAGQIVALKGLGGFHLICNARDDATVERLRVRKHRDGRPFAVMVPNLATARHFAEVDAAAADAMELRARPIVVVPKRPEALLAGGVSNGLPTIGLFLPYTPVHWLVMWELLGRPAGHAWMSEASNMALVATSANHSGEPIVIDGADARRRLAGVADAVADHDRAIVTRADDSVMRVVAGAPSLVRRARGFTPVPISLAQEMPNVVALGAQLKSTVAVIRGREAFVSQHVGDLDTPAAVAFLEKTLRHMLAVLEIAPVAAACDLHPDFPSTRLANSLGLPVFPVQHHHAHIAALAAEHGIDGPVVGVSLDGFGLGPDGAAWGGELLCVNGARYERLGHLAPLPAPGGDRAAREPWRMAAAALHALGRADEIERRFAAEPLAQPVRRLLAGGVACPPTTSAGRLFDAAAGLLGVSRRRSFEGEAAMRLEALAATTSVMSGGWQITGGVLDVLPLLGRLADGVAPAEGAALFHGTLIAALTEWVACAAASRSLRVVALGGGCFLNKVLTEGLVAGLRVRGLTALVARAVPPNDGGLSLGQAFVAASALLNGRTQEGTGRCVSQSR